MAQSIYGMIYDELDAKRKHMPEEFEKYSEAFDLLDREAIAGLILDGITYWIEWPTYWDRSDDKGILQLHEYLKRKGYKDLYSY